MALWDKSQSRKRGLAEGRFKIVSAVAKSQSAVAASLIGSFPKKACVGGMKTNSPMGFEVVPRTHECVQGGQMSIHVALSRPRVQPDLRDFNNANLTMVIADLWHAKNLSDLVVETVRFHRVLELA